jgi:hypothetical protein
MLAQAQTETSRFGGRLFVAKPIDVDELLEAIQSLIGSAERDVSSR